MEVYLRISKLYLEEADHVLAEAYINRAGMLQSDVARTDLHIIYKVLTYHRVFNSLTLMYHWSTVCLWNLTPWVNLIWHICAGLQKTYS